VERRKENLSTDIEGIIWRERRCRDLNGRLNGSERCSLSYSGREEKKVFLRI